MARVPEAEVQRLKKEVSVERLAQAAGVELSRRGADLHGRCPFHEDKTPSLVVSPEKNLWHCLGACGVGGGPIDWVMKVEGVSFRHAVELLREGAALSNSVRGVKETSVPKLPAPVDAAADDAKLLGQVADYYHRTLKESPEANEYLTKRGLASKEAMVTFRLGFSNRTLGLRLPQMNRAAGAEVRGRLQQLGVIRESGHEHLNGSLVVPLLDEAGAVVGMYGRKVTPSLRPGTPLHLYLPGPHRGVFNRQGLVGDDVILCEALLDALSFWVAGFTAVTAAYGVEGFTSEVEEALVQSGAKRVLIAFDRDEAGDRGAARVAERLVSRGLSAYRVLFPKGMDANEYAQKVQPAEKSLGLALRQATWVAGPRASPAATPVGTTALSLPKVTVDPQPTPASRPVALPLAAQTESDVAEISTSATTPPPLLPATPRAPELPAEVKEDGEVVLQMAERRYRVRGLAKNASPEALKVNLLVGLTDGRMHVDTLDLYAAKARAAFLRQASEELQLSEEVLKRDVGLLLLKLESLQEAERAKKAEAAKQASLSEAETKAALELLQSPALLDRIAEDLSRLGLVGEDDNKLLAYLAAISRKLEKPLAVVVQSTSAAGKSSLVDAVLSLVPEEERVTYSAMTGQALFYMADADLKHKVLSIAEEEGASRAAYALKLLQSEGRLAIASTGKDPETGRLVTQTYEVEGPVALFLTTTKAEVDEELLSRCLVLAVNEEATQTRAIHQRQAEAETLEGLLRGREKAALRTLHQNAQRLLRPLSVVNPHALSLHFPAEKTRARRDFPKYLALLKAIALVHQHQREVKQLSHLGEVVEYVEVTKEDVVLADRLFASALARSQDELPPQTKRLLGQLEAWVPQAASKKGVHLKDFRFSRRDVREALVWGDTQLKIHLGRLVELELLCVHRAPRGGGFLYELQSGQEAAGRGPVGPRSAHEADRITIEKSSEGELLKLPVPNGRPHLTERPGLTNGVLSYATP